MIAVGINENSNSLGNLVIYPVPTDGSFTVNLESAATGKIDIQVINELGVTVYLEQNIPLTRNFTKTIDLRPVATGIYTVILRNNEGKVVRQIIIR